MLLLLSYFHVTCDDVNIFFYFVAVPEPVAFYPLNARYKAAEKENRKPKGILGDVAITNGPYSEPGGAYMFHGTVNSYIAFPNKRDVDIGFSITLMCWVQPGGQDGPLFSYGVFNRRVGMAIEYGKFSIGLIRGYSLQLKHIITAEVLPPGKWVHAAASYDHNTGNSLLYINGHLKRWQNIGRGYMIRTTAQTIRMGGDINGGNRFKGKIAEMKVYDVPLNEAQIQTSIRRGSCTFPVIVVSLTSPMIPLIIETPVIGQPGKR